MAFVYHFGKLIIISGMTACLVGLDDSSDEEQEDVFLKVGQAARVNHPLKTWHPVP